MTPAIIQSILNDEGLRLTDIDRFIVDGWGGYDQTSTSHSAATGDIGRGISIG